MPVLRPASCTRSAWYKFQACNHNNYHAFAASSLCHRIILYWPRFLIWLFDASPGNHYYPRLMRNIMKWLRHQLPHMDMRHIRLFTLIATSAASLPTFAQEPFSTPDPVDGLRGNPNRGKAVVIARDKGNCLACHALPIPAEPYHGSVGPSLEDIGSRMKAGELRFRIIDQQRINPYTIMPGFYRKPELLQRVLDEYAGKTILTAQELEDVVAYLLTLKNQNP